LWLRTIYYFYFMASTLPFSPMKIWPKISPSRAPERCGARRQAGTSVRLFQPLASDQERACSDRARLRLYTTKPGDQASRSASHTRGTTQGRSVTSPIPFENSVPEARTTSDQPPFKGPGRPSSTRAQYNITHSFIHPSFKPSSLLTRLMSPPRGEAARLTSIQSSELSSHRNTHWRNSAAPEMSCDAASAP
jgi:hypothetical protein